MNALGKLFMALIVIAGVLVAIYYFMDSQKKASVKKKIEALCPCKKMKKEIDADDVTDEFAEDFGDLTLDTDGDGVNDAAPLDVDGDGKNDAIGFDTTGDGKVDTIAIDTTGDGELDTLVTKD